MRGFICGDRARGRGGQAVILLLAVLVVLVALAGWLLSIRGRVMARLEAQDGGDAAALAAARWQAAGLNLCGELNLIQAYMLADDVENAEAAQALHELRQRIQLVAPVLGLMAAQRVAEANGMEVLPGANDLLEETRQTLMPLGLYAGAEADLREMLGVVLREELRVFPLSPVIDMAAFPTWLAEQDFYEAVLGRDWCWFWFNAYAFLQNYRDYRDFGRVPELSSEPFFGLRLGEMAMALSELTVLSEIDDQLQSLGHPALPPEPSPESGSPAVAERPLQAVGEEPIRWTVFRGERWGAWEAMAPGALPLEGRLREAYDYDGASAAVSVQKSGSTWLAAAKAFGGVGRENPTRLGLVMGGFDQVRLIPVDAAEQGIRGYDVAWLRHLRHHVRDYAQSGRTFPDCHYCLALEIWAQPAFRAEALAWLAVKGNTCRRPKPGHGASGGSRYAH